MSEETNVSQTNEAVETVETVKSEEVNTANSANVENSLEESGVADEDSTNTENVSNEIQDSEISADSENIPNSAITESTVSETENSEQFKVVNDEVVTDELPGIFFDTTFARKVTELLEGIGVPRDVIYSGGIEPAIDAYLSGQFSKSVDHPIGVADFPEGQEYLSEGTQLFLGKEPIILASGALIHWAKPEFALAGALALSSSENMQLNNQNLKLNYDTFGNLLPLENQPGVNDLPKFCSTITTEEAHVLGIKDYEKQIEIFNSPKPIEGDSYE